MPYRGSRHFTGSITASVCMEGRHLHGTYTKLENGVKLFVIGETMVGLLMGQPDGERNTQNMQDTKWWGKDSRQYMKELIEWSNKE